MKPPHILHADWGTAPSKRWIAQASLGSDGRYTVRNPNRIENHADLIPSIGRQIGAEKYALVGFDLTHALTSQSPYPFNLSPKDGAGVVIRVAVNRYGVLCILSMDEAMDSISALDPVA